MGCSIFLRPQARPLHNIYKRSNCGIRIEVMAASWHSVQRQAHGNHLLWCHQGMWDQCTGGLRGRGERGARIKLKLHQRTLLYVRTGSIFADR